MFLPKWGELRLTAPYSFFRGRVAEETRPQIVTMGRRRFVEGANSSPAGGSSISRSQDVVQNLPCGCGDLGLTAPFWLERHQLAGHSGPQEALPMVQGLRLNHGSKVPRIKRRLVETSQVFPCQCISMCQERKNQCSEGVFSSFLQFIPVFGAKNQHNPERGQGRGHPYSG